MKKTFAFLLTLCLIMSCVWIPVMAEEEEGAFTEISSFSEITDLNGKYKLKGDITVAEGTSFPLLGDFAGTLDGNNKTITISDSSVTLTKSGGLLFTNLAGGTVTNLTLQGTNGSMVTITGTQPNMGAIAGKVTGSSTVVNVTVNAIVTGGRAANSNLGGFFAKASDTLTMTNCTFNGFVIRTKTPTGTTSQDAVGGLIGNVDGTVTQNGCQINGGVAAAGQAAGRANVGYFCGTNTGTVNGTEQYSAGVVKMKAGAGVRAVSESDSGLRFRIYADSQAISALTAAGFTVKLGSLIAPTANVTAAGAFTKEALDALNGTNLYSAKETVAGDVIYEQDDGKDSYFASLIHIQENNYTTAFSAVGYITITKDEVSCTVYADYNDENNSRTIRGVATEALEAENLDTNGLSETQEGWLQKYIDASAN